MKKHCLLFAMLVTAIAGAYSQAQPTAQAKVPNAETAVKVAEAALIPVYGEKKILSERPFKATLEGDVWTVAGTLHCGAPQCVGRKCRGEDSKSTGQILHMIHYK